MNSFKSEKRNLQKGQPQDLLPKIKEYKPVLPVKKSVPLSFESELAMAQKSLKLLKAKMATPKPTEESDNGSENGRIPENTGNYRKIFKPDFNGKQSNNSPLEEIPKNNYNSRKEVQKPEIKLISKDKKPSSIPSQDDFEYYDKNTRDYSKYQYQDQSQTKQQSKPLNPSQKRDSYEREDYPVSKYNKPPIIPPKKDSYSEKNDIPISKAKASQNPSSGQIIRKDSYSDRDEIPIAKLKELNSKNQPFTVKPNQFSNNSSENDNENQDEEEQDYDQEENNENDDNEELVPCTKGCGRSFKASVLNKHMKICKKVFQSKRKVFDSSKIRTVKVGDEEVEIKNKPDSNNYKSKKAGNWKQKSLALRSVVKQGKGMKLTEKEKEIINQDSGLVPCNFCGRKFNEIAAEKHIIFCEKKTKMEKIKNAGNNKNFNRK